MRNNDRVYRRDDGKTYDGNAPSNSDPHTCLGMDFISLSDHPGH